MLDARNPSFLNHIYQKILKMSLPNLTPDLMDQIFSWLPVKPLVRFKCVSKYYQKHISESNFIKLHLERSPKNTHVVVTLLESIDNGGVGNWEVSPFSICHLIEHPTSIDFEDGCHRFNNDLCHVVGSVNGLVCFIDQKIRGRNKYIYARFWNPALRLTSTELPDLMIIRPPPNDMMLARIHLGFGYDVSTDTYKVRNILITCYLEFFLVNLILIKCCLFLEVINVKCFV